MINLKLFFFPLLVIVCACNTQPSQNASAAPNLYDAIIGSDSSYNATMAAKLGADERGMKPYVMAFLKRGPNRNQDSITVAEIQKGHMDNINRMAESGKLVLAGPFMDDGEIRGIYLFNVPTIEEAQALTATDPAIKSGRLIMELHPWYGSAAMPLITPLHRQMEKK
ncbi:MAG: hypothetical protein IT261_06595 [Saprospiraceae bacterium]|nr:hypothetical protein [Saprospiraceae bacterium]